MPHLNLHLFRGDGDSNDDDKDDHIQTTSPAHSLYVPFLGAGSVAPSCATYTISPFFCDTDISSRPRSSKYKEAIGGADWNTLVFTYSNGSLPATFPPLLISSMTYPAPK